MRHLLAALALLIPLHAVHAQGNGKVIQAAARQSEFDQPITWLLTAKENFTAVKDYSCTLVSQERVKGTLQEANMMSLKVRSQPFSVYMRWLQPKNQAGQEVAFVMGKNNNKMRVKSVTLGKGALLGFISIDPNDPRVTEHSRHTILEAGIGTMIEQILIQWDKDRVNGKSTVSVKDYTYNNRECHRIEIVRGEKRPEFYCYRSVVFLEKQSKIPFRLENYDWPRQGGTEGGDLLESFSYVNLQFNTGLKDADFDR